MYSQNLARGYCIFVGRKRERDKLNTLYAGDRFKLLYFTEAGGGGKTTLTTEFQKDKEGVTF